MVKLGVLMAFLFRLLSRLPLPLLHNLGALFGWLHWLASPVYRRHMRENMALAGVGDAWSGAIAEAGKTIFELPKPQTPHIIILKKNIKY